MAITGALTITGELEMDGTSIVDANGGVTVSGTLNMDGSSRLKMEGDLTLNSATLEAETGTGINLDENASQEVKGDGVTGDFVSLVCSKEATVFSIDATISDSLDAGGEDFTISDGKTLTMDAGSVTVMSGGDWTRTGTLTLNATSKVLYTTADQSTMTDLDYGHIEHDGGDLGQEGALVVLGTFTNTSGDFAASENLQAKGIIWTDGAVTENPEQEWAIGTDGIIINGGTFVATTGTFTVEGNWFKDGGTLTATNSTVNFNGATAQTITSGGGVFYSVSISNTSAAEVSLLDPFEFNGSGTLTISAGATFATAG
ncbi:MAG: hypothetical protein QGF49_07375, partial [Candidatus Marinimicrobia bacterium]|nr:hypothetical protein [Candidatus Neomarinimicrobiota bacterium]